MGAKRRYLVVLVILALLERPGRLEPQGQLVVLLARVVLLVLLAQLAQLVHKVFRAHLALLA